MIDIRLFNNSDLNKVLKLIESSDSTNRSPETWNGNRMTAVLAFDKQKLIGAIPFEPRSLSFNAKDFVNVLWVSGAHVEPQQRNQGIGSAMDIKIKEYFYPEFKAVFVFRQDENSPAYRWYKKIGYHDLLSVISLRKSVEPVTSKIKYTVLRTQDEIKQWGSRIYGCFTRYSSGYGGFPLRDAKFWSDKLTKHYYKDFYSYSMVLFAGKNTVTAYAFIGKTDMKDGIRRLDILEMSVPPDNKARNSLYKAIMDFAAKEDVNEVRIQVSPQDHILSWLESLGFSYRWKTNMMGKLLDPVGYFSEIITKKQYLRNYCFNIQSPGLGNVKVGSGRKTIALFAHDIVINEVLMCRSNVVNAIEEGRIVFLQGRKEGTSILKSEFGLTNWRYSHVDYI